MLDIKEKIAEIIKTYINSLNTRSEIDIYSSLSYPPQSEMGDIAFPCFILSKNLKKSPAMISKHLEEYISCRKYDFLAKVQSVSGYVNFYLDKHFFTKKILQDITSQKEKYGSENIGNGKSMVIDFSAPNIAKPFHIGHLRSTVIGNSLYKIFQFMGYKAIGINHLGDWGTQFGKLIVAYKMWGDKNIIEQKGIQPLMELYVKFHSEAENNPELEEQARAWFTKMEQSDAEALELWRWFKEISLKEFKKTYELLNIQFDSFDGESFYNDKMPRVVEELESKGLLIEDEGASLVSLEEQNMPPCMILKKDGSSLYATRDIAASIYRKETYNFEKCIYVTGVSQSLHFKQWFSVINLMGYDWASALIHVPFGTVSLAGEKLSTRSGKVVLLEEILSETIRKTLQIIEEKNPNMENKLEVAKQIGVGAIIFSDLYSNRIKDASFSWDEILNFDGETGPYVQYTYARTCSILKKAQSDISIEDANLELLDGEAETYLIKSLSFFPERIRLAMSDMEPSIISRYLIDLCQAFNRFYKQHHILSATPDLKLARLVLVSCCKVVLSTAMQLIGLFTPESV